MPQRTACPSAWVRTRCRFSTVPAERRRSGTSRAVQALEVKGGELREGDLPEGGERVAPDEGLVAGVGRGPDPAPRVGEPLLQVVTERRVLVLAQDCRLDHRTATLALVPGPSNWREAP